MDQIRVLIADDQTLMRDGLKTVLELEKSIKVVGTAKDGFETLEMSLELKPDVVLMDIRMSGMDGVESTKIIKSTCPGIKVVILTTFNDEDYIIDALANGASGYVLKDIEMDKLVEALHDAVTGKMIIPPAVAVKLSEGLSKIKAKKDEKTVSNFQGLSDREKEIVGMMVQGFTNQQIALALHISEGTVRNYISNIYNKIGTSDRTKAVLYFKEHSTW